MELLIESYLFGGPVTEAADTGAANVEILCRVTDTELLIQSYRYGACDTELVIPSYL